MEKSYSILAIMPGHGNDFHSMEAKALDSMSSGKEAPDSRLLSMHEGVGIIEVKGKLTNRDSYYNSWYGLVSYNEIRAAVVEAVELGAGAVLFDIDSPGGAVSGMSDLSTFIYGLDIDTVSHTSGTMASAAYFNGISSDSVFSDSMAEVGSVGVVMTLIEQTEAMKKAGYTAEIFRSGKHKYAGNPYEKITTENRKYLQGQVMTMANKFYDFVSENRGIPRPAMADIETGRTFIGEEALTAGLVDKIMSFDEALAYTMVLAEKNLDNSGLNSDYYKNNSRVFNGSSTDQGESPMAKKAFSKAAIAAMVTANKGESTPTPKPAAAEETKTELTPEELEAATKKAEEAATKKAEEADVDGETVEDLSADLLAMTEKYDESQVQLAELTTKIEALEAEAGTKDAVHSKEISDLSALSAVIASQIGIMRTALSLSTVDMADWKASAVLTEYESISTTFEKSLPVGGVVPEESEDDTKEATTRADNNNIKNLGF